MNWGSQKLRRNVLIGLLVATSAAAFREPPEESTAIVQPAATHGEQTVQNKKGPPAGPIALRLDQLHRHEKKYSVTDIFSGKSWYVPPPAPIPVPPSAPPIPFTYMGKIVEDGIPLFFLSKQERSYSVKPGDILDGTYRVDAIETGTVTLTYLPLNIKQTLSIGATN